MFNRFAPSSDNFFSCCSRRGKHKIFIGMAPGVGKTYRMLEEAITLKAEGIDVVVGLLETHRRQETAQKAKGLEIIPPKEILRGGLTLTEMDTEAILPRSPQLVLVDELAHTNIPGSEREQRYQDVKVILAAGIDVYSTVNIQHLESLNTLVAKITGVVVRDRIPDWLLEEAQEVVVVDVTPETLQERLQEGKIYASEKIYKSVSSFFQRRNLIALRELALREVADKVEQDANALRASDNTYTSINHCNIHERVLVCVSTYPKSQMLLLRGAQFADYMNAPLYAVFVADPDRFVTKDESLHIETCEQICQELGGTFIRVTSDNITRTIAEVTQTYHITQIVIGESQQTLWQLLLQRSLTRKLLQLLKNVDLHIIASEKTALSQP